ncbi:NAD(P)/FAD-dependent oxidoreductase [Fulvivirga sp. RKSG066]|uniref:NAD(P)/FAD-dependent oxidoreductase n=1 Tax=Fulvivirga aurantia TaxID=2529383 RepID=UPI0012BC5239|nr:NAD(P)/FAD-dependent oxidoreductase [Fulvivirga aurantia]MTI20306.1 NAD(P)/FAD-dependent oxidoreductase [Fulvivirga aurantia]
MQIAVIGAGAAGYFAAFSCKRHHPDAQVTIFEKTSKVLQKVKVSGGGRCNVTHNAPNISDLTKHYPRGANQLKKCFGHFNVKSTIEWFEGRGVKLKSEADNRMFPVSDSSQTIIDCFNKEAAQLDIEILLKSPVKRINIIEKGFELEVGGQVRQFDKVIITSGGSPKLEGFKWLSDLGHEIKPPVPSLFTFNMPGNPITKLMGLSVNDASVKIVGSKLQYTGPLLITHWGMSGPAVLKLSAWGARELYDKNYDFKVQVNWSGYSSEEELRGFLGEVRDSKKKISNYNPIEAIPGRLWSFLLDKIQADQEKRWLDLDKKSFNKLVNVLINDQYDVKGKTTFKEEFVTCGGVALEDVNFKTMESRKVPGMYFAGEVLDVDGITGGFNFQAAWSTAFVAGKLDSADLN